MIAGELQGEDVFRQLIEDAPDAMLVVDDAGAVVFVNRQAERTFGHARADLLGRPVETLIPERFRGVHSRHRERFAGAAKTRPMGSGMELFGVRQNGDEFPVEISLSPLQTGTRRLVSAAIRDITDRKLMEAAANRANQLLANAVESFPGAFAVFDEQDRLIRHNSAFRVLFGAALDGSLQERRHSEIVDANIAAGVFELGDQAAEDLRRRFREYHQRPEGAFEFSTRDRRTVRLTERRTSDGCIVCSTADITGDIDRQTALDAARAEAESASAAKSEFLSSMSHELRTPLNAVLGFAQLLQMDKKTPLTERQQERLQHVVKGGEHLLRLIDDVLDLSRIEAGRVTISVEPVNVADVLREVTETIAPMAERGNVALSTSIPPELPDVEADRTRFAQVLMNYGSNGIKYGRPGGRLDFVATQGDGWVRVSVRDDGMGIPEDKQPLVFQPFQRAGQETGPIEGTGIGLAISKRLAEIMRGRVGFNSSPGRGSEFWIELNAHEHTREPKPPAVRPAAVSLSRAERHLVVYIEDNPSNIAFMEALFADLESLDLMVAPTAEIGIDLVRARRPSIVIMDMNLPGMSGFEATRRLQEWPETQDIPVVALSAAAMVHDRRRISTAGFYRYLTKPVKVEELNEVLGELLARSPA